MKPAPFLYVKPSTIEEVCNLLDEFEGAQILAGGQSLMPAVNMRLANPTMMIDINGVDDLGILQVEDGKLRVGAIVRHNELARSPIVGEHWPLLVEALHHVAHISVRNRGTHCGSIALAHPSAEMPACAVLLDASIVLVSKHGRREVPAREFFIGPYETVREPSELIIEVCYPLSRAEKLYHGFDELAVRHGDFAITGATIQLAMRGHAIDYLDLVVFGCEPAPRLCIHAAEIANGRPWGKDVVIDVASAAAREIEPMDNELVRRRQTEVIIARILERMWSHA